MISLEISNSKLADKITPPRLVRELDWVEKFWPSNKKGKGNVYPKVQLYCLMGVAQAWTVRDTQIHKQSKGTDVLNRTGISTSLAHLYIITSSVALR